MDPHRLFDKYTDVAGRAFVNRTSDRPGNFASDRLHHRGSQAGAARFLDLVWTDAGVVRYGAVLSEGCLLTVGCRRLHQPHLGSWTHLAGADVAGVAHLARLEGPLRQCQEVTGMVNPIWLFNDRMLTVLK